MQSGSMYLLPLDSQLYALIPTRRWYAPWLWDLECVQWHEYPGGLSEIEPLASKLRYPELTGMMRLLGARLDQNAFHEYLGEQKWINPPPSTK